MSLQGVTVDYMGLHGLTRGYKGYKELHGVTRRFKGLGGVAKGYRG